MVARPRARATGPSPGSGPRARSATNAGCIADAWDLDEVEDALPGVPRRLRDPARSTALARRSSPRSRWSQEWRRFPFLDPDLPARAARPRLARAPRRRTCSTTGTAAGTAGRRPSGTGWPPPGPTRPPRTAAVVVRRGLPLCPSRRPDRCVTLAVTASLLAREAGAMTLTWKRETRPVWDADKQRVIGVGAAGACSISATRRRRAAGRLVVCRRRHGAPWATAGSTRPGAVTPRSCWPWTPQAPGQGVGGFVLRAPGARGRPPWPELRLQHRPASHSNASRSTTG